MNERAPLDQWLIEDAYGSRDDCFRSRNLWRDVASSFREDEHRWTAMLGLADRVIQLSKARATNPEDFLLKGKHSEMLKEISAEQARHGGRQPLLRDLYAALLVASPAEIRLLEKQVGLIRLQLKDPKRVAYYQLAASRCFPAESIPPGLKLLKKE